MKDVSFEGDHLRGHNSAHASEDTDPEYGPPRDLRDINRFVDDDNEMVAHRLDPWGIPVGETSFRIFSEVDDPMCIVLQTNSRTESGDWSLAMSQNDNEPPELADPKRIEELEEEIEVLEQELAESEEGVSINVEVRPGEANAQFVEGGTAIVEVTSETADLAEFEITYGNERYRVAESGTAKIPLPEAGTHQMTFSYGDVTERLELEVMPQNADAQPDTGAQSDDDETGLRNVSTPGFVIGGALIAIVLAGLASRRLL